MSPIQINSGSIFPESNNVEEKKEKLDQKYYDWQESALKSIKDQKGSIPDQRKT